MSSITLNAELSLQILQIKSLQQKGHLRWSRRCFSPRVYQPHELRNPRLSLAEFPSKNIEKRFLEVGKCLFFRVAVTSFKFEPNILKIQ